MKPLTQKWTLVSFLEPVPLGFEFSYKEWPRHITIVDVFAISHSNLQVLLDLLFAVASNQSPIKLIPSSTAYFGPIDNKVLVQLYEQQQSLYALHTKLTTTLEADYHATFNNPEYNNEGYMPHETLGTNPALASQQNATIDNLALIDMFPHKNGFMRSVVVAIPFSKHEH